MTSRTTGTPRIVHRDRIWPTELAQVRATITAAIEADGVRPVDEAAMLDLEIGSYLLALSGEPEVADASTAEAAGMATSDTEVAGSTDDGPSERLAGFVRLVDGVRAASADLVVHPAYRRRGVGGNLLAAALEQIKGRELRIWAHGPHPGAAPLAAAHSMSPVRHLWRMGRSLLGPRAQELPEPSVPPDVRIRAFHPGRDDQSWLRANAIAFADHPEQGQLTHADLRERMAQPWFSSAGFFVAERSGRIIGFHWTKVHPAEGRQDPVGEVYVLGVAEPAPGLGTALTLTGLRHLAGLGIRTAMLFTESDNKRAIGLYRKLGFAHTNSDVMYAT